MAAITVGTAVAKVDSSAGSRLWIQNQSTNITVYWSTTSNVTTATGIAILPGGVLDVDNIGNNGFKVYLIASAAGADVRWDVL